MTDPARVATAHLLLTQLGVTLADLQHSNIRRPPAPSMAEYLPWVIAAASPSSNRLYGPYWNRMAIAWATGPWTPSSPATSKHSNATLSPPPDVDGTAAAAAKPASLTDEPQAARVAGLEFMPIPIIDRDVPDPAAILPDMRRLAERLRTGDHIVNHCRIGIGRASLLAAGILVLNGIAPEQAWQLLERARGHPVPDTPAQREWPNRLLRHALADDL